MSPGLHSMMSLRADHSDIVSFAGRPRGRPPGSKNRKTILKEAGLDPMMEPIQDHPLLTQPSTKKRGRPPGSKNKKTLEAMQLKAEGAAEPAAQPVSQIPEEAVATAAAASGILEIAPSECLTAHCGERANAQV